MFRHGKFTRAADWEPLESTDNQPRADDLMGPASLVVPESQGVRPVLEQLLDGQVDAAVVIDGSGKPVGIFTEHDAVALASEVLTDGPTATDWGSRPVISVQADAIAGDALDAMADAGVRHVVVLDGTEVESVLSWRDLVERNATTYATLPIRQIEPVGAVETAHSTDSLRSVADRMRRQRIGCMPVLDPSGQLVSVVTRKDLIAALLDRRAS